MKKILIIDGHQNPESLSAALAERYHQGAERAGHEVKTLSIRDLKFDLILHSESENTTLEPDLVEAQKAILQADHLVFVYPIWWGTYPALLKGFIDRTFLSGFAFKREEGAKFQTKLLKGKTARLVVTMDTPKWYYSWIYKSMGLRAIRQAVLHYCGISPVKSTVFTPVYSSTINQRSQWLSKVDELGYRCS